jgi:hypothetical protein
VAVFGGRVCWLGLVLLLLGPFWLAWSCRVVVFADVLTTTITAARVSEARRLLVLSRWRWRCSMLRILEGRLLERHVSVRWVIVFLRRRLLVSRGDFLQSRRSSEWRTRSLSRTCLVLLTCLTCRVNKRRWSSFSLIRSCRCRGAQMRRTSRCILCGSSQRSFLLLLLRKRDWVFITMCPTRVVDSSTRYLWKPTRSISFDFRDIASFVHKGILGLLSGLGSDPARPWLDIRCSIGSCRVRVVQSCCLQQSAETSILCLESKDLAVSVSELLRELGREFSHGFQAAGGHFVG